MAQDVFPFVVGCGRSGTTLVRAMLDSHPELAIPGESRFIPVLARTRDRYERGGGFDVAAFVHDLEATPWFRHWGLPADDARSVVAAPGATGIADAFRALFAEQARREAKPRYGDKSPQYVMQLPLLAELFPEARFLHVVRDGRDVALAFASADFGPSDIAEIALHWQLRVRRGMRYGRALGPQRYREVRYEDIVAEPEATLRGLCPFLGLAYDPAMLRYPERSRHIAEADRAPEHHYERLAMAPTVGLRDWRSQMTDTDVAIFEVLAGRTLTAAGYERSTVRPSMAARAQAARTLTSYTWRRLVGRVPGVRAKRIRDWDKGDAES
jgi:hypothetical protein